MLRMPGQLERCVPTFRVKEAEAACAYFTEKLGFQKDWEHRFEPGLPLFISVSRDDIAIHLSEHTGDGPFAVRVYIYVRDPDALYDELKSRGARIRVEIQTTSHNTREFMVEDLDGNCVRFGRSTRE